jgi:hypothetical protein
MNEKIGRILRTVAIVLLGLTAAMNILGGVGTTCAAFGFTREYRIAFHELQDVKWLYQTLVFTTILTGLAGSWATVRLARGKQNAFRNAMIILVIGSIFAAVQYITSQILRGEAAPANVKFFTNALTLVVFLLIRLPSIWQHVDFSVPDDGISGATAGGFAAIVAGVVVLSVSSWAGPSHTYFGQNWVLVLERPLQISGFALIFSGVLLFAWATASAVRRVLIQQRAH